MPNLAQAEIALTRLSPCWERGASPPASCNSRSAPRWCVSRDTALTAYCTRMLLCGHGWRWLLWPPGGGRDTALSLQACWKHPLLPSAIPGQASKLQGPKQSGCGQVGDVGCWSVF